MELKEFFEQVGGDYEKVLLRLPTPEMIKRFVCKFADDSSYEMLKNALEMTDIETAFRASHTLKGTAANLGLDALASAASILTEALRDASSLPEKELICALDDVYHKTVNLIANLS